MVAVAQWIDHGNQWTSAGWRNLRISDAGRFRTKTYVLFVSLPCVCLALMLLLSGSFHNERYLDRREEPHDHSNLKGVACYTGQFLWHLSAIPQQQAISKHRFWSKFTTQTNMCTFMRVWIYSKRLKSHTHTHARAHTHARTHTLHCSVQNFLKLQASS